MASKLPPFTDRTFTDNEKCLLGAYILGAPICEHITEAVFYLTAHKTIFPVIREFKENGLELNLSQLINELKKRGLLDKAGGFSYVSELVNDAFIGNTSYYEDEVLEAHRSRSIYRAVMQAKEGFENGGELEPEPVVQNLMATLETITTAGAASKPETGIFFKDLLLKKFPLEDWIIANLITTGLTVLTGASKIGKSWTALQMVTALDQGGFFLGTLKAQKCDCLYFALEDTEKRIQKRLKIQGMPNFNGSRLETKMWPLAKLRAFLKANEQYRVIIIDTFQKAMGLTDLNDYAKTVTGMSSLKAIADDLGRAIIVIHHNRKSADLDGDHMESALGSTGINATADCTLTMRRKRGDKQATMQVSGRDVEDTSYTLKWDKDCCFWTITDVEELKPSLPEAQQQILDIIESGDREWTTAEIIEKSGKTKQAVNNTLAKLKENGLIQNPAHGIWQGKSKYTSTPSLRESVPVYSDETYTAVTEPMPEPAVEELEIF